MKNYSRFNHENHIKTKDFSIEPNRDLIFHLIDCYPSSPIYNDVINEYEELKAEAISVIDPVAIIQFGRWNPVMASDTYQADTPSCYVFMTIGDKITQLYRSYFNEGNYLAGMLINAIADDYLFQMDKEVEKIIRKECLKKNVGIACRLEPQKDIPMEAQKIILEESGADWELSMGVTEGFMFTSLKSSGYILILSSETGIMNYEHDCSNCDAVNCKLRKPVNTNASTRFANTSSVFIDVVQNDKISRIDCKPDESIKEALDRQGFYMSAYCGGRGTCGKCKIKLENGNLEVSSQDKNNLSKEELEKGYRLSCKAYPKSYCKIRLISGEEKDFEIVSDSNVNINHQKGNVTENYAIAVDIGTTTIAMSLVGLESGHNVETYTTVNKQRAYGADVISRIQASNNGKGILLRSSIQKDLLEGFRVLIAKSQINKSQVKKIAIACNTTMEHLLMGYSCVTLGVYPFTPVNIKTVKKEFREVFESDYLNAPVILLPGISTYVGADIVAGLTVCNFDQEDAPCMLIDLGTNGEMAIGQKHKILVSSTAAGPAFEGGNISCGVGSVSGAICSVTIDENNVNYQTIGKKPVVGICGTGVIDITSELMKNNIMDETGLLDEKYFDHGFVLCSSDAGSISFTQKDIREMQLAKAAVRAGIETLLIRYGVSYDQINTVYLAGGFGYKINIQKAISIGLLPEALSGKIKAIGNSSLAGAVQYLTNKDTKNRMEHIVAISKEIELSNDKDFNRLYVENMYFN